jgi:hypothetical protein
MRLLQTDTATGLNNNWGTYTTNTTTQNVALAADSSGNIYAGGIDSTHGSAFLIKWNSSGTIQWQRSITLTSSAYTSTSNGDGGSFLKISGSNIYFTYNVVHSTTPYYYGAITLVLPTDGSQTGSYSFSFGGSAGLTGTIYLQYSSSSAITWVGYSISMTSAGTSYSSNMNYTSASWGWTAQTGALAINGSGTI